MRTKGQGSWKGEVRVMERERGKSRKEGEGTAKRLLPPLASARAFRAQLSIDCLLEGVPRTNIYFVSLLFYGLQRQALATETVAMLRPIMWSMTLGVSKAWETQ